MNEALPRGDDHSSQPGRTTIWLGSYRAGAEGKRLRHFLSAFSKPLDLRYDTSESRRSPLPARDVRHIPSTPCRRPGLSVLKRTSPPAQTSENVSGGQAPVLHCLPLESFRGKVLEFHSFDEAYVDRLRSGDYRTQEHFSAYFSALIKIKLGSRLRSPEAVEDLRQETFARFFIALRDEKILRPECLGSFINSICNNVLLEHYRSSARDVPLDVEEEGHSPVADFDMLGALNAKEIEKKVREILQKLPKRDRQLLRQVFLEERDKDDVCRELGVDRDYLRVLLHRAKQTFKSLYLKHAKIGSSALASAQKPWNAATRSL